MYLNLSSSEAEKLKGLLRKLADRLDSFIPNVRGASDPVLEEAKELVVEAFVIADRIDSTLLKEDMLKLSYSKSEMVKKAIDFMSHVDKNTEKEVYYRDLGLLTSFICDSL